MTENHNEKVSYEPSFVRYGFFDLAACAARKGELSDMERDEQQYGKLNAKAPRGAFSIRVSNRQVEWRGEAKAGGRGLGDSQGRMGRTLHSGRVRD
jgi:hypothetical protein